MNARTDMAPKSLEKLQSGAEWQRIRDEVIAKIWDFLDRMRAGQFVVNPTEKEKTCRFCDYSAVCRYDRYRIQRKLERSKDDLSV